jgi:heme exporter protein CcmD
MATTGVLQGGWEFVWAAYAVSATVLFGYALLIHLRYRAERERARRESARGGQA